MEAHQKITAVLVASPKPERYSNMAVKLLMEHQIPVFAIGRRSCKANGFNIISGQPKIDHLHTLSLYLNPQNQMPFYDYILALKPRRVLFNPGTENDELQALLTAEGIEWEEACTLVLLRTHQF